MKAILCLFTLFSFQFSLAQEDRETVQKNLFSLERKSDISLSFMNFQEDLRKPDQSSLNESSQLYGFSLGYNLRFYRSARVYSLGVGFSQGSGVAGTKEGSAYYHKRVPWQAFHAQVGIYHRFTGYFEMGPVFLIQQKSMSWPASGTVNAENPPNPSSGAFMEFRQHLGLKYDFFQNIGILGESRKAAWNLGVSYNL